MIGKKKGWRTTSSGIVQHVDILQCCRFQLCFCGVSFFCLPHGSSNMTVKRLFQCGVYSVIRRVEFLALCSGTNFWR